MVRYHTAKAIKHCTICGKEIEIGERTYIQVAFEQGDRRTRKSIAGFACNACGENLAELMGLEAPLYCREKDEKQTTIDDIIGAL